MTPSPSMPPAIGILLPSSNRVVERVARDIFTDHPDIDVCFARVPYAGHPPDDYDLAAFDAAVRMLAEARPDVILWNATRGALLGFEPDRRLTARIEAMTGILCTTTALATVEHLRTHGHRRIGLLAQGDETDGRRLRETFAREGIDIVTGHDLGIGDNFEAAAVEPARIDEHVERLAAEARLDAVLVWSTNLSGHRRARADGATSPVSVLDSASLGILSAMARLPQRSGLPQPTR